MSQSQYETVVKSFVASAKDNRASIEADSIELMRRYNSEKYGTEKPGRSSYVSNDVQDVIEADMPSLARSFLGANKICVFPPSGDSQENIDEAKQKTEYIDWLVRGQRESFRINHGFLKDIEILKIGALKWSICEDVDVSIITKSGFTEDDVDDFIESQDGEVELISRSGDSDVFDLEFKITKKSLMPRLIGVPVESLLFSPNAVSEEDASLVGDVCTKTRGELLQDGFDVEVISEIPTSSSHKDAGLSLIRPNSDGVISEDSFADWATQTVEIYDLYVKVDKDGDGVAERRHIVMGGDVIIEDEPFEKVPYAITSAILSSHSLIGTSRAELAAPTAKIQTALKRGLLDNGYLHNRPRVAINDRVEEDDLLSGVGVIHVDGEDHPANSMHSLTVPYIGNEALQVIQYMDQARAQTTGSLMASQGLSADDFGKETATRFNGVQDASKAKIELVARVIANAYSRVYDGMLWLASEFQSGDYYFMAGDSEMLVTPSSWKFKHKAKSKIGLGAGDGQGSSETLAGILALQSQLKAEGSSLVDEVKRFNTIDATLKAMDIHDTSLFFNNPERPEQLIVRENEILKQSVEQLQQMVQELQNPLAEAEKIKQEAFLLKAENDAKIKILQEQEKARQFDVSTGQKQEFHDDEITVKLTELELENSKNIEGSIV